MESIWKKTCKVPERERLCGNKKTEVAVIGAGMAGILIASFLQAAGKQVVVLEANRIASGQTGNTTAKITSQHGAVYSRLIADLGVKRAQWYAAANQTAIGEYRRLITEREIDCDFEETSAYVYGAEAALLQKEAEAAKKLGLSAAFVRETALPFPTAGAVKFDRQAQFHPLKFLKAMAEDLTIYEHTAVSEVDGQTLHSEKGSLEAEKIIFACHFPFVNFPGAYFARMHQERSYVIALERAQQLDGMYIGAGEHDFSFRNYGRFLLVGGGKHRTGENVLGGQYARLRQKAAEWFPGSREAACWSAQDCITPDSVPYIGQYAASRPNWYVATGFQKWGMTASMVSAMAIRDMVCGKEEPWHAVFAPHRFTPGTVQGVLEEGGQAVKGLTKRFFEIPSKTASDVRPGYGGVVLLNGKKAGIYKREDGAVLQTDFRCPHMGCQLTWNPDEKTWDCPCHGSRFDAGGRWISGPAQEDTAHG